MEEQGTGFGEVLGNVAQPFADIFSGITKLITTNPNRIGRSIVRQQQVNLHTNNDDVMAYFISQNQALAANGGVITNKKTDYTMTILTLAVLAMIVIVLINNKK